MEISFAYTRPRAPLSLLHNNVMRGADARVGGGYRDRGSHTFHPVVTTFRIVHGQRYPRYNNENV